MLKYILCFLWLGISLNLFSQANVEIKDPWEDILGTEKKNLVMQAVANADTSLEVNTSPIINYKGNYQPFLLLDNGNKLLFYIREKNIPVLSKSVDVYSYTDAKMQDEQLRDVAALRNYAVVFDFKTGRLIRLEKEGEKLIAEYGSENVGNIQMNDQYTLLYDFGGDIFTYEKDGSINDFYSMAQYSWNKGLNCNVYLVSLKDGLRKLVKKNVSPGLGDFAFFRFSPKGDYVLSYENRNYYAYNIATGVTNCISKNISNFFTSENFREHSYNPARNIIAWNESAAVMVKDANSDIWELDLSGKKLPVKQPVSLHNQQTKNSNQSNSKDGMIATEEITWKDFNGKIATGVLAKPKDFDPKKKYPIIFIYYEASVINRNDNRPYGIGDFVDYGYLVFSPDINYTLGETGKSVFNAVVSAAEYLSKKSYVDATRMGIKGASFGGYETNYLVTHSHLFAAAISSAGYSDLISNIGAMNNGPRPHGLEGTDQNRMGVTMWERPDLWIKNSPIFYADRVTTPLLLIHSKSDDNVPFEQSLEFFRALRSLGKRSWLLQYDDAGHMGMNTSIIGKPYGNCDFCTRQLQFFNHYLKGDPAPVWMLDGIPARDKGKKTGLELDTLGRTPGPGLRREKLQLTSQQEELLKHRTMVTDDGRIIEVPMNKQQKKLKR